MARKVERKDFPNHRVLLFGDEDYSWNIEYGKKTNELTIYLVNWKGLEIGFNEKEIPELNPNHWLWVVNGFPKNGEEEVYQDKEES